MPPDALVQRLRSVPGADSVPELAAFDPGNDLHLDAAAGWLLERFRRDADVDALSLLYELARPRLHGLATRLADRLALAVDPDDLVAAFLTRLFTDVRRPQPRVSRFLGLAYTSMRNDALNQLRSHARSLRRMAEFQSRQPHPADPARLAGDREQEAACARVGVVLLGVVARCFHQLPERDRRILLAREVEGLTHAELAVALSLPPGQTGSVLRRARLKLSRLVARALSGRGGTS